MGRVNPPKVRIRTSGPPRPRRCLGGERPRARVRRWPRLPSPTPAHRRSAPARPAPRRCADSPATCACPTRGGGDRRCAGSCSRCSRGSRPWSSCSRSTAFFASRQMFRGVSSARSALTEGAVAVVTGDPEAAVPRFEHAAEAADSALAAFEPPVDRARAPAAVGRRQPRGGRGGRAGVAPLGRRRARDGRGRPHPRLERTCASRRPRRSAPWTSRRSRGPRPRSTRSRPSSAPPRPSSRPPTPDASLGPVADGLRGRGGDAAAAGEDRARHARLRGAAAAVPGAGAERRYLLAIQTLGRPQGTGGEVDLIGVLSARDGVVALDAPLTPAGAEFAQATATTDGRSAGENLLAAARDSRASASSTAWCSPIPCGSPTPCGRPARSR